MGFDIHEWMNREPNADYVAAVKDPEVIAKYVEAQPPPKNDPVTKPLWPMIIGEHEARIVEVEMKFGPHEGKVRRLMVADMRSRHEFGVAKYGVPLVAKNGRDHLLDAYQEFLDAIVYFRAEIEMRGGTDGVKESENIPFRRLLRMYRHACESAADLREMIYERDGR